MAVIKTIDLVGVSGESWRDAAQQALAEAAKTIRGSRAWTSWRPRRRSRTADREYHTHVRIRFRIER